MIKKAVIPAARYIMPPGIFDALDRTSPGKRGGTIISLTLSPLNTMKALRDAGVHGFVELEPSAKGVDVEFLPGSNQQFA